jgi:hypothetical protein
MVTEQTAFSPDTGRRYRVLVVEDEALMRSIIMDLMRGEGYEVAGRGRFVGLEICDVDGRDYAMCFIESVD